MYWVLNVSAGSVDDGLRPKGDVVGVLLEGLAIGGAVKQARQLVVNGIVVNIGAVNKSNGFCRISERLVIARDYL